MITNKYAIFTQCEKHIGKHALDSAGLQLKGSVFTNEEGQISLHVCLLLLCSFDGMELELFITQPSSQQQLTLPIKTMLNSDSSTKTKHT